MAKILKQKRVDFLERYNSSGISKGKKSIISKLIWLLPITVAVILVIGAIPLYNTFFVLQPKILLIESYVDDPNVIAQVEQAMDLSYTRDEIQITRDNYADALQAIDSFPGFTQEAYNTLRDAGNDISIVSILFARSDATVTVVGTAEDVLDVSAYVKAVEATELFSSVHYGYSLVVGRDSSYYSFSVLCILAGGDVQ